MEAKELRIGNYFRTFDGTIEGYRIEQLTLKDFAYISEAGGDFCDYGFEPVSLDEEWLLRLGLKRINKEYEMPSYSDGNIIIDYVPEMCCYWLASDMQTIPIIHVHQLQDLYFSLTGTELKLTS
jgi:hypothetical protein